MEITLPCYVRTQCRASVCANIVYVSPMSVNVKIKYLCPSPVGCAWVCGHTGHLPSICTVALLCAQRPHAVTGGLASAASPAGRVWGREQRLRSPLDAEALPLSPGFQGRPCCTYMGLMLPDLPLGFEG